MVASSWIFKLIGDTEDPMSNSILFSQKVMTWAVPQMSIIIIYNSTWSILIQKNRIKLSWQSDLENTKERPLHKIKANLPHWAEFEILRNGALWYQCLVFTIFAVVREPMFGIWDFYAQIIFFCHLFIIIVIIYDKVIENCG